VKALIEHIRTVHFTVLVVALILTAALQIDKKRPLERAAADAEAILRLQQRWEDTSAEIRKAVDASRSSTVSLSIGESHKMTIPEPGLYDSKVIMLHGNQLTLTFRVQRPWIFARTGATATAESVPRPWSSLREFLRFWDEMHDGTIAFLPLTVSPGRDSIQCGPLEPTSSSARASVPEMKGILFVKAQKVNDRWWEITPTLKSELPRLKSELPMPESELMNGQSAFPVCEFSTARATTIKVDLGHVFAPVAPQAANWGTAKSAEEFSELIAGSKYLEDSPLGLLAAALRERANSDTERIELFQAKLPADAIPTYGTIILICCQFYLLAHFIELRRIVRMSGRLDETTGYIGLYDNRLTFIFSVMSMTIVPLTPLLISVRTTESNHLRYLLWPLVIASAVIGAISALLLVSIRKEILLRGQS
jgi:hypothetical protein